MNWFYWTALISLIICLSSLIYHFIRLISLGKPVDYSKPAGKTAPAIKYSMTSAMSPAKKESAFLHMPTYAAGMIFHLGTFLGILLFFFMLLHFAFPPVVSVIISIILGISGSCGLSILIKRLVQKKLRDLSNPDDYISNILVTLFHYCSAVVLLYPDFSVFYFVLTSILLLYLPLGKLKHTVYFFAARYHLGLFFGWRGVWPPKKA
jgi:hypothetical protein